ncbi:MAG: response regulator [Prochloraceae cyanobacterium]
MYDRSRHPHNLNDLQLLSQRHKQIVKDKFYKLWKTCHNEMIAGENRLTITPSRQPIVLALKQVMETTGVLNEIRLDYDRYFHQFFAELNLKCPTCKRRLNPNAKVGKYIGDDEFWHSIDRLRKLPKFADNDRSEISKKTTEDRTKNLEKNEKIPLKEYSRPEKSQSCHQIVKIKNNPLSQNIEEHLEQNRLARTAKKELGAIVKSSTAIACIDDNKTVQVQVKRTLEWAGYKVLSIVDPGSSMTALARHQPKLILMDINMPYFDGYELCQMLQKSRQLKDIPIVIFSSRDTMLNRVRAKMCGAVGFISKPIAPLELIDFVNNIVPITPESLLNIYVQQLKSDRS